MQTPQLFIDAKIQDAPITYKWSFDISDKLTDPEYGDRYEYILNEITALGYKATIAMAAAICEWIFWRLEKHIDKVKATQAHRKIEALWVASIDAAYLKQPEQANDFDPDKNIEGPIWDMLYVLYITEKIYLKKSYYIHEWMVHLILQARHVMPKKKMFNDWLSEKIKLVAASFPRQYDYSKLDRDKDKVYDDSKEGTPPRDVFFAQLDTLENYPVKEKLNEFLASIDYSNNPYLYTPEEMIANGFKGTPYTI